MEKQNILIIDDDHAWARILADYFKESGHYTVTAYDPETALAIMNNTFNLVYIDYMLSQDKNVMTGSDLGLKIRYNYPLAGLVLMTAYFDSTEYFDDFIYVGFDSILPKSKAGESSDVSNQSKDRSLLKAINNAQKRVKSIFQPEELESVKTKLDYIEEAISKCGNNNLTQMRIAKKYSEVAGGKSINYNALTVYCQLWGRSGNGYNENALKIRQLIIDNPTKWKLAKTRYAPINKIKKEFHLQ